MQLKTTAGLLLRPLPKCFRHREIPDFGGQRLGQLGLCINGSSHSEQGEQGANHSYLTKREK